MPKAISIFLIRRVVQLFGLVWASLSLICLRRTCNMSHLANNDLLREAVLGACVL